MPTNKRTIKVLEKLVNRLEMLGVRSIELKTLKRHIGQQKRQIAWEMHRGKWRHATGARR